MNDVSCTDCMFAMYEGKYRPELRDEHGVDEAEYPEFIGCSCEDEVVVFYNELIDTLSSNYRIYERRTKREVSNADLEFVAKHCPKFTKKFI